MYPNSRLQHIFLGTLTFVLTRLAPTVSADINVDLTATPVGGGIFQYQFDVSNTGPDDVAVVSIVDAPVGDPLIAASLVTAPGFLGSYDSGLGFVDFIGDTELFAVGTTTTGFMFQSAATAPPYFTRFEALTINGESLRGNINVRTVPEAGSTLVMAGMGMMALFARGTLSLKRQ